MIGNRLGQYQITAKMGEGGMEDVCRATDTKLEREVHVVNYAHALARARRGLEVAR